MKAAEVFGLQKALRAAKDRLSDLFRALDQESRDAQARGALVAGGALDHPEYRALAAEVAVLAADAAAAQEQVGGVVYRVASEKLDGLVKKLDALNKRAAKHDLGKLVYIVTDETETVEVKNFGRVVGIHHYTFVTLAADRLKIAGWALLAKLSVEEAGVMVAKVPAYARAWAAYREGLGGAPTTFGYEKREAREADDALQGAQTHLDTVNLAKYADAKTASQCDHCGLARRRTATYVVESLETGETKQVGSNCLRDFLGTDPHQIAKYAEWLTELDADLNDDGEGGYGSSAKLETPTLDYLTHVCTMLRTNGWAAKSGGGHPTAAQAADNRYYFNRQKRDSRTGEPLWVDPTEADEARAKAALQWADEHLGAKVHQTGDASDFDRNLYIAAKGSVVTDRTQGTLAYLPVAHARFLEREIEQRAKAADDAGSEHVGTVGARMTVTAQVMSVVEHEGNYGTTFITQLRDADGNVLKWFGSYGLERGATVTATWTVKKHDEYKGVKETVVTRPAKLTVAESASENGHAETWSERQGREKGMVR